MAKPYYGNPDLADACEASPPQTVTAETPNPVKTAVTPAPPGSWSNANSAPPNISGIVENVDFGGGKK